MGGRTSGCCEGDSSASREGGQFKLADRYAQAAPRTTESHGSDASPVLACPSYVVSLWSEIPSLRASWRIDLSGKELASRTASALNSSRSLGSPPDRVKSKRSLVLQLDDTYLHIGTHKSSAPICTLGCLVDTTDRNLSQSNPPTAIIVPVVNRRIKCEEAKCRQLS